jgi:hypothetical protein
MSRSRNEAPLFTGLDATAFSFAFELIAHRGSARAVARTAFRLGLIADELAADGRKRTATEPDVYGRLVEPVRSFLDDVTTGPPGTNGRPLFFAASGAGPDDPSRAVTLIRPETWDYAFEGETTELTTSANREVEMRLRDSFCAFESGRLYYILTLTQPSEGATPLDEYGVIQLQQLALDPAKAADPKYLGFDWAGGRYALVALANARLKSLRERTDREVNGIRDVIEPFGLLAANERHQELAAAHLRGLCIGIEDDRLFEAADHAARRFAARRAPAFPEKLADLDAAWKARAAADPLAHLDPDNRFSRGLLALAGICQAVPDFPAQDESEIHDSTRPTAATIEASLHVHPRFLLEIGKSWRSFKVGRPEIGTCPYLLLSWMVALHDEATVADIERRIDDMIYGAAIKPTPAQRRTAARADPLADLIALKNSASNLFGQRTRLQERNLAERLELFRWASIHRSGNIFRYPKEKGGLAAVLGAMGTEARFAEAQASLDRYRELVESVSTLASSYAEKRIGRLLTIISFFGLLAFPKMVKEFGEVTGLVLDPAWTTAGFAALLVAVLLFLRRR